MTFSSNHTHSLLGISYNICFVVNYIMSCIFIVQILFVKLINNKQKICNLWTSKNLKIAPSRIHRLPFSREFVWLWLVVWKTSILSSFSSCWPFCFWKRSVFHHFKFTIHSFHQCLIFINKSINSVPKLRKKVIINYLRGYTPTL